MNLEAEYAARLREFLRETGNLRKCTPSCTFPDSNHEIRCPERPAKRIGPNEAACANHFPRTVGE